jgi:signal transduction histidine kinase
MNAEARSQTAGQENRAGNHEVHEVMARFAHELRNYLGTIRNATRILHAGLPVSDVSLVLIERQIEQMTRLVDDLLDVSRIRTGRLHLHCDRIDLCRVVSHSVRTVKFTMQQRNHCMTTSLPDTPLWVQGDAGRLEQVFVNLLINAAKYTDAGGRVDVSVTQEANEAVTRIRDSGVGISADVLPQVFDLYMQANPSSRSGGLGLGLPLVRSLVERHGGRVAAASGGAGRGSEFTVRLPIAVEPRIEAAAGLS